jgi:hypothetical protein
LPALLAAIAYEYEYRPPGRTEYEHELGVRVISGQWTVDTFHFSFERGGGEEGGVRKGVTRGFAPRMDTQKDGVEVRSVRRSRVRVVRTAVVSCG